MSELKRSIGTPFGEVEKDEMMENRIYEALKWGVEWDLVKKDSTCSDFFIIKSEGKFFTFILKIEKRLSLTDSMGVKEDTSTEPMCFGTETLEEAELLYNRYKREYEEWEAKKRATEKREAEKREAEKREAEKREAEKREAEQREVILRRVKEVLGYDLREDNINIIKTDDDCMDRFIIESEGTFFTFIPHSTIESEDTFFMSFSHSVRSIFDGSIDDSSYFISDSQEEAELFYKMDQKSLIIKK